MTENVQDKIYKLQHSQMFESERVDGWLLYDFRRNNDLACQFLDIKADKLLTRRFFYWIPAKGIPCKIVHGIESNTLDHLPGTTIKYRTWQELEQAIGEILNDVHRVAMEYSPKNALPYISKVDAGTVELVRSFGVDVVSSANLLLAFISRWDEQKLKSHVEAADVLSQVVDQAWDLIRKSLSEGKCLTEYAVQQFILERFTYHSCESADPPICAVNKNSANPHYVPSNDYSEAIKAGDFILIDLWCKKKRTDAVYADICRVGVASEKPTERQNEIFHIVRNAQKSGTALVKQRFVEGKQLKGWEVDQCCRDYISQKGFGAYFIHRTGHNIDNTDHGSGAHLDNYETHDDRILLPNTCFSIEPGIYLPEEFGIRLEYNVYIHSNGEIKITGGEQDEIVCLG